MAVWLQPVAGLQVDVVQGSPSSGQVIAAPVQVPLLQASPVVQSESSEHRVPFGAAGKMQPEAGLQESVVQALPSLQASWPAPGWQAPLAQTSPVVQTLPSLQTAVLSVWTQAPVAIAQTSSVQALASLQFLRAPD
ncbi:MAG: hypothetical protein IPK00_22820 [Deltaproteobacteria bacterium]|nr:hypothetical protein [Deltaproteobacteria bacterium]